MTENPDPLVQEIEALLGASASRDDPARLERILTDGYARALMLETQRSRIQKRIGRIAVGEATDPVGSDDLSGLVRQLSSSDEELGSLRALLARLRMRYSRAQHARTG